MVLLLALAAIVWLWQFNLRARETAIQACRRACNKYGVQLLDDTIAADGLWLRRSRRGTIQLERRYVFEFTTSGATRQTGLIVLLGNQVTVLALDGQELLVP